MKEPSLYRDSDKHIIRKESVFFKGEFSICAKPVYPKGCESGGEVS
jgi:hypothetical protein